MERQILHIDVNNAFLSWAALERLKNGETLDIREVPAVIGGDETKRSGIVLAKSMLAKKCGVKTAETIYSANALICKFIHLVIMRYIKIIQINYIICY